MSADIISIGAPPTFRQELARVLEIEPQMVDWVPTVTAVEEMLASNRVTPKVLALSPAVKDHDALALADFVSRHSPSTAIVIVRDGPPDGLLPLAMRAGVRDVVDTTQGSYELREAVRRALSWSQKVGGNGEAVVGEALARGRVFSVFSSKGGTGKSFLAANLAVAVSVHTKAHTALADLDLQMGDAFAYFGKDPSRPITDLLATADSSDRDAVHSVGTYIAPNLWGYGSTPDPAAPAMTGDAVGKFVRALRSSFPYTVVDTPGGYTDHVLGVLDVSDLILVVASLDVVGVRHMALALDTLMSLGVPRERFRVVLNRADSKVALSPQEVERVMKLRVDAMIPSSRLVPTSLNLGRPAVLSDPRSPVAKSVTALAESLIAATAETAAISAAPKKRGVLRRG